LVDAGGQSLRAAQTVGARVARHGRYQSSIGVCGGRRDVDAAIASLFALTVVEPMMIGIFGAGMSTIRRADGEFAAINNYAVAPAAATPDMYQTVSDSWAVPGGARAS